MLSGSDRLPKAVPFPAPASPGGPSDLLRTEKSLELKKETLPRFEDDERKFSEPDAREVGDAALIRKMKRVTHGMQL